MGERVSIIEKFKSPGICYYSPKYNIVDTKPNIPIFKVKKIKNDPKLKIQKLWRSYNTQTEYQTVNLK